MSPSSTARAAAEKPPRLIVRFAVLTALGLALAAVAIAFVVRTEATAQAQRNAIERARFAAAVLTHSLRPADLSSKPEPVRRRELDRLLREHVLLEGIVGVALYDSGGRLLYSAKPGAPRTVPPDHVREALAGVASSSVGTSSTFAGKTLRTSVPIVLGGTRPTTGIAIFEQDFGPIEAAGRRAAWLAAAVLEGLLVLLFLALAPVLVRVTTRIRRQIGELERAVTYDEATGTANRIGLRRAIEGALASNAPGALLLVDIDDFSELNEVFGSDEGDAVLREVALRLRWELAGFDVARAGEDEFGVLIDSAGVSAIEDVAARIHECLTRPVSVDAVRVAVSVSIGAAALGAHDDFDSLLHRASVALTVAKDDGPGETRVYEPALEARLASRATLLAELRAGLQNGELLVHFQPQVDLVTRQIRGVEALLRWQHPARGLLPAGEFVQEAERSGLAMELRRFALESSARCWLDWNRLGLPLEISVNLGPVDLIDASLPEEIEVLLEAYGIPPWNLVLEITERTLALDERRAREVIDALHRLGVRFAIDDFGTGYSSLSSLQRFPVQIVKLDRSLFVDVPAAPAAHAIVRGSIELAHAIGATVVAEGIETREQWKLVRELGCDIAQGYFVGRPAPAEEVTLLLQSPPAVTREAAA